MTWTAATIVADSADRPAWLKARAVGITASDIAKAMTPSGRAVVITEKMYASGLDDNPYMAHGRDREPVIAAMLTDRFGMEHNTYLFAGRNVQHLATPDCISLTRPELAEIKTSTRPLRTVPRVYVDQMLWQMWVLEADRVLLAWEQHTNGIPTDLEPTYKWVDRDEKRITELRETADELLEYLATERSVA